MWIGKIQIFFHALRLKIKFGGQNPMHYIHVIKLKLKTMATRSLIGMNLDNGITKVIYCHWDGYPAGVGQTLVNNYTSPSAVLDLLGLGDLSSLDATPTSCTAYHRDRKEPYDSVKARDVNTSELTAVGINYGVDYVYIYNNEFEWECYSLGYGTSQMHPINILADVA